MEDRDIFLINLRDDTVYVGPVFDTERRVLEDNEIKIIPEKERYINCVIGSKETHEYIKKGEKIVLRVSSGEKQVVTARIYQDTRDVITLQVQRFTKETGSPHKTNWTFVGDEITKLINFLQCSKLLKLNITGKVKFDSRLIENNINFPKELIFRLLNKEPDLLEEFVNSDVSKGDILNINYRKQQLGIFYRLLTDDNYLDDERKKLGDNKRNEDVWQNFFEKNTWIFGYGLNYIFSSTLEGKKLEQVTKGSDFFGKGKRIDGLLKSQGIINSLCFCEIKTHKTPLLKNVMKAPRPACWPISSELTEGISQLQKTVQMSLNNLNTKIQMVDESGYLTNEELYLFQPNSYLIIGSLNEFMGNNGINEEKFSSFEIYRNNLNSPKIITFDELYARASCIVDV